MVEMVSVDVTVPEPGVMLLGEKEQVRVLGKLAHESEIGLVDVPDCTAAVTTTVPDFPVASVTAVGDAVKDIVVETGVTGAAGAVARQVEM